jgi:hypothetical protein
MLGGRILVAGARNRTENVGLFGQFFHKLIQVQLVSHFQPDFLFLVKIGAVCACSKIGRRESSAQIQVEFYCRFGSQAFMPVR